jgi:hypothetical protein
MNRRLRVRTVYPYGAITKRHPDRYARLCSRWRLFFLLIGLAVCLAAPLRSPAQDPTTPEPIPDDQLHHREISIWGSATIAHPHLIEVGPLEFGGLDVLPQYGRRLDLLGVRFDMRLWNPGKLSLRGNTGVIPLAVFSQHAGTSRRFTYGGGLSEGLELTTKNPWKIQPNLDAGVGFFIFTQPTPVEEARRFNFTFYFGPGFRIPRYRMRVNIYYNHFSNMRTATFNPGLDSLLLCVSYTIYRGPGR